jgi:hypothetical protein
MMIAKIQKDKMLKKSRSSSALSTASSSTSIISADTLQNSKTQTKHYLYLDGLREVHYVPYCSCNAPTIYSYRYWERKRTFLLSTKANNFNFFSFKRVNQQQRQLQSLNDDSSNFDTFSGRNSFSSTISNNNTANINDSSLNQVKNSFTNSQLTTDTDRSSINLNDIQNVYLEPNLKIHKFSKIKSKN